VAGWSASWLYIFEYSGIFYGRSNDESIQVLKKRFKSCKDCQLEVKTLVKVSMCTGQMSLYY